MWGVYIEDEDADWLMIHVCPTFGKKHDLSPFCWCDPIFAGQGDQGEVWEHHQAH